MVYHDRAVETGSLVVSACGFDSVPAELGLMFNSMQWVWPTVPNRVEAYVSLESDKRIVGNYATYESAVLGVTNTDNFMKWRRSIRRRARPSVKRISKGCFGMLGITYQRVSGIIHFSSYMFILYFNRSNTLSNILTKTAYLFMSKQINT